MSYNQRFQSNNTELQEILNDINNLPEAGNGGSDANYKTIQVINNTSYSFNLNDSIVEAGGETSMLLPLTTDLLFLYSNDKSIMSNGVICQYCEDYDGSIESNSGSFDFRDFNDAVIGVCYINASDIIVEEGLYIIG